ncbi:class I SAM-dependent DNA methyltransferase [Sphingomonas sp. 10B4]|uniref:class I SAM-dependent DNA methyltransferase n=1 Tax=Sphingomonas sp. 10B4 TaxID=3048575 RepID=UPI002AB4B164|nr:DNA methyltransferase [Sphingomonas sp. 10B4]MDY7523748.1 N-6 DNA methylase [Sphingomonas sp. 10B4]MEB0283630.1 N-6 DNA methylase [Sphingomonas sp. 10B4]
MRLGWDEIKRRARAFSKEWQEAHYEKGETQSFYNDFFDIFGIKRRRVATYEQRVKLLSNKHGFMDLFWPRTLLIEQKSAKLDLDKAGTQALDYIDGLPQAEQPRYVLTCDFQSWRLLDLDTGTETRFKLADLHKHIEAFAFVLGRQRTFETQAGVTIKAAELMGKLHDALEAANYKGHDLEQLLVRLLFCMFADDTGIFQPKDIFLELLQTDTREDGSDTGRILVELFDVLDTPESDRQTGLSGELNAFPYINGQLFAGHLRTPVFDTKMRALLIDACRHDWTGVSPAIFGSLFQSVMDAKERRSKGAHYTSEANIMKVIGPLFLDDLRAELDRLVARRTGRDTALLEFQAKLSRLTFLDPACGCGNFLVIGYRELRRLELACLQALYPTQQIDAVLLSRVTVEQFYGIEIEEFPARIAEVAMWMADHLANNEYNEAFQGNSARIPLKDSPHILNADALDTDWAELVPPEKLHYIMGNPPFVGKKEQSTKQKNQLKRAVGSADNFAILDYVAAWFVKAGEFVDKNPSIRIAFVSTNSITQGEQVAQLWPILFDRTHLEIAFAHRTFSWNSEARGTAHVHVVVTGLAHRDNEPAEKRLFSYPDIKKDPVETRHTSLTAYLFDALGVTNRHLVIPSAKYPINGARRLKTGVQMIDNGLLTFTHDERDLFLRDEPAAEPLFRDFLGGDEYINGFSRSILYLAEADPAILRALPRVMERMRMLRDYRSKSERPSTLAMADYPTKIGVDERLTSDYLVIPNTSSERRAYVPIGWLTPTSIANQTLRILPDATFFEFGVLTSRSHMSWLAHIGGRMKSDYRYSNGVVYNTFPWPDATSTQRSKIEQLAQAVLKARAAHPTASLADLYDPDTMPGDLRRAHHALDLAVDRLYRPAPFASDRDRVEHLFGRYEALVNPLATTGVKANRRVARKSAAQQDDTP